MAGVDDISIFSPSAGKRMWQATLAVERSSGFVPGVGGDPSTEFIKFRNDSGEELPAYAIMQATGTVEDGGQNYLTVDKPLLWTAALVGPFFFNGPRSVADGEFGTAQCGPIFRVIKDSTTLSVGMRIGPVNNQWTVGKGCLYSYIGTDDVATDCIRVVSNEAPLLAHTSTSIPAGGSGTVVVRVPSSTIWSAGTVSYDARNDSATAILADRRVIIFPIDAKWHAVEIC